MQKYKVFINDNWIFFGELNKNQFAENEEYDVMEASDFLISGIAEMIKAGNFDRNIVLYQTTNTKEPFNLFLSHFLVLHAAGGIVQNSNEAFLMINRFGVWDFPKGKIEKGEGKKEAALREVEEETGVQNLEIIRELPSVYHIYRFGYQWIVKRTNWFLMRSNFIGVLNPQKEEDILEAVWVPKAELTQYISNTYGNLKELVKESGII